LAFKKLSAADTMSTSVGYHKPGLSAKKKTII